MLGWLFGDFYIEVGSLRVSYWNGTLEGGNGGRGGGRGEGRGGRRGRGFTMRWVL